MQVAYNIYIHTCVCVCVCVYIYTDTYIRIQYTVGQTIDDYGQMRYSY